VSLRDDVAATRAMLAEAAARRSGEGPLRVLDLRREPTARLAGVSAVLGEGDVPVVHWFCGADHWGESERRQALAVARPHLVWDEKGTVEGATMEVAEERARLGAAVVRSLVMVPTGGTSGQVRFAMHGEASLRVAARGVVDWLGGRAVDALCFLPLYHVSGLMQAFRCAVSGGRLLLAAWKQVETGAVPLPPEAEDGSVRVTSLVPTQLGRLLARPETTAWLQSFDCVFLGGAAAAPELLEAARAAGIRLAPCYGMTETAAQVCALRPDAFLDGERSVGRPLPHVRVSLEPETARVIVESAALFLGYYPEYAPRMRWRTGDRAEFAADGSMRLLGRVDRVINTGGEKVDPQEVERALLAVPGIVDAVVFGRPDAEWGQVVEAAVVSSPGGADTGRLRERLRCSLAPHKIPKRIHLLSRIPRTPAGKPDLGALTAL